MLVFEVLQTSLFSLSQTLRSDRHDSSSSIGSAMLEGDNDKYIWASSA